MDTCQKQLQRYASRTWIASLIHTCANSAVTARLCSSRCSGTGAGAGRFAARYGDDESVPRWPSVVPSPIPLPLLSSSESPVVGTASQRHLALVSTSSERTGGLKLLTAVLLSAAEPVRSTVSQAGELDTLEGSLGEVGIGTLGADRVVCVRSRSVPLEPRSILAMMMVRGGERQPGAGPGPAPRII